MLPPKSVPTKPSRKRTTKGNAVALLPHDYAAAIEIMEGRSPLVLIFFQAASQYNILAVSDASSNTYTVGICSMVL